VEGRLLWEYGGEFGIGNVGKVVGNIVFNWVIGEGDGVHESWEV
jgi:hypothetical protein